MLTNQVQCLRAVITTLLFLLAYSSAEARLKDTPPKNLLLDGSWQIDADASDDVDAVLDGAGGSFQNRGPRSGGMRSGRHGGSSGGMEGHHGRGRPDSATESDPPDAADKTNRRSQQKLLGELIQNPPKLVIVTNGRALKVSTDTTASDCEAGEKVSVIDGNGTGERQCGWDGRAWLVETAYARSFTRSDRYEISKDGKQVIYSTKVSGGRLPSTKINRIYIKSAAQSNANPAAPTTAH